MPKLDKSAPKKLKKQVMKQEMHEFKEGKLRSGKGLKPVKLRKQAVAIALSVSGQSKKKKIKKTK